LNGGQLVEAHVEASTYLERLPPKIRKIQKELPAWIKKTGNQRQAAALLQKLDGSLKAKKFEEAEEAADSLLKLMGSNADL
jgi:hypothetical protein